MIARARSESIVSQPLEAPGSILAGGSSAITMGPFLLGRPLCMWAPLGVPSTFFAAMPQQNSVPSMTAVKPARPFLSPAPFLPVVGETSFLPVAKA